MPVSRSSAAADAVTRFEHLPELKWPTFEWLVRQGVPISALVHPETLRRARVVFHADTPLFDFAEDVGEDGVTALIFLARDETDGVADLVAWTVSPSRLARHWGAVSMLGSECVLAPRFTEKDALPVFREPLAWLRAGRFGVVPIAPRQAVLEIRDFGPFAAEDEAYGQELREVIKSGSPKIYIPQRRAA